MFYFEILNKIPEKKVILFHSAPGKDSIALIDMLSKQGKKVLPVFMYIVKGLEFENKYIQWAEDTYKVNFMQVPHHALLSYMRVGYMGITKDEKTPKYTIAKIDEKIRNKTGINYSVYGFKKIDGITRRMMLNDTDEGIHPKTNKCYPLMDMKNSEILMYIEDNNLIRPFNYTPKLPSSGCDISTPEFLIYMRENYPEDLQKIYAKFPLLPTILIRHEATNKNQ
jgi:sulfate adenylyltransferase subunit 2